VILGSNGLFVFIGVATEIATGRQTKK